MNGIHVKIYLLPDYAMANISFIPMVDEIRRFGLPYNAGSTGVYNNLIEMIKYAYGPSLINGDEIRTYWHDKENELIGFSTDSEFQNAINAQAAVKTSKPLKSNPNLFKVYIKKIPSLHSDAVVSFGDICDYCNSSLKGTPIRFKCSICSDYQVCPNCYSNCHHSHQMYSVSAPVCHGGWNFFQRRFSTIKISENNESDKKKDLQIVKKK